jgi:excisionase family DNA binding protein
MSELTTDDVADRLGIGRSTVTLWCRQGRFPGARSVDTPRGAIWYVPEAALKNFTPPQPGRPPKPKVAATKKRAAKKGGKK